MRKTASLAFMAWMLGCSPVIAWGVAGHHIVARVAASELTPKAQAAVADLLGEDAMAGMISASTWADEIRASRPVTAPWHYVDIEIDKPAYDATRDCQTGDCVVAQILRVTEIIGDAAVSKPVRAEALRFLIHFVGDLHQPLHCGENHDRGGNSVIVILEGRRTNLHAVWDSAVVEAIGGSEDQLATELGEGISAADRFTWARGTVVDWANESLGVAKASIYHDIQGSGGDQAPLILSPNYAASKRTVVVRQLQAAAVRLASLLNQRLK